MRQIKFRGRRLDNGEWVYGSLLYIEDTCFIIEKGDFDFDYRTENHAFWFDCTEKEVNPDTIGQFTGLLDRNGKEIYEGDIVAYDFIDCEVHRIGIVKWFDELACFALFKNNDDKYTSDMDWMRLSVEVIGNIHDNPALLNGK